MREITITKKLYQFEELSEKAKERALNDWYERADADLFSGEYEDTLKKFESIFGISARYEVDLGYYHYSFDGCYDSGLEEISEPLRLAKYIYNNFSRYILKEKLYWTPGKWEGGNYTYKSRHSKIVKDADCVLTGVCYDEDILKPVYDCITYKAFYNTADELFSACLDSFFKSWADSREYCVSEECFAEECSENDWEFEESGKVYA